MLSSLLFLPGHASSAVDFFILGRGIVEVGLGFGKLENMGRGRRRGMLGWRGRSRVEANRIRDRFGQSSVKSR